MRLVVAIDVSGAHRAIDLSAVAARLERNRGENGEPALAAAWAGPLDAAARAHQGRW